MQLCTDTITVLNSRWDPVQQAEVYYPTVISGVSWYLQTVTAVDSSGIHAANQCIIRIPEGADFGGKGYLPPLQYRACEDPAGAFTLAAGDMVVHAAVEDTELRPADLKTRFDEVVTILAVTDNRRAPNAPHWKVVGK